MARTMSKRQRAATAERMRQYWATRRKAKDAIVKALDGTPAPRLADPVPPVVLVMQGTQRLSVSAVHQWEAGRLLIVQVEESAR